MNLYLYHQPLRTQVTAIILQNLMIPTTTIIYPIDNRGGGRNHSSNMSNGMLRAMDNILALSMLLKGTTPELMATERQRREEAEELRANEASRVKVQQWLQSSPCVLSYLRAISH
jgi:hypothetical protein